MTRNIEKVFPVPPHHWVGNGFRVHNFFPGRQSGIDVKRMSPWFLMDYESAFNFPPSKEPRGVAPHPHRGIETVSIIYQGKIAHHDSVGNGGVIGENDVQWMTAGSGILHKEYLEEEFNRKGGICQMVQLWTNLPKKYKMTAPTYQDLLFSEQNKFISDNKKVYLNVIAGSYKDITGKANVLMPIELYDLAIQKDSEIDFNTNPKYNFGMLVVYGSIKINERTIVEKDHFFLFENDGTDINIKANENAKVLILGGEPIDEPIVPYGPFVMNTMEEIREAYKDYEEGKFGYLE